MAQAEQPDERTMEVEVTFVLKVRGDEDAAYDAAYNEVADLMQRTWDRETDLRESERWSYAMLEGCVLDVTDETPPTHNA